MGNTEKGVKQGKSSYPLLSMKKDQANKTNVERVYRWWPLVWEPGPNGSGIDLQLVREWVQCSCISCASMLWSWSRVEAEGLRGGKRWVEKKKEGCTMTWSRIVLNYWGTMGWRSLKGLIQCIWRNGWKLLMHTRLMQNLGIIMSSVCSLFYHLVSAKSNVSYR